MSLFHELKRRNVIRVAVAYLVLSWVVLQVMDVLVNALELPSPPQNSSRTATNVVEQPTTLRGNAEDEGGWRISHSLTQIAPRIPLAP